MIIMFRKTRILRAPEADPAAGGAGGGAPPAPAAPAAPPAEPFATFTTPEAFNRRVGQEARSQMREHFGTDNPEEVKAQLAELNRLKAAEQERQRQEMTELQRTQTDLANERARASQLENERNQVRFQAHVSGVCARLGVANVDYALYVAETAVHKTPDGQQLDVEAHLKGLIDGDQGAKYKAAFGIVEPPAPPVQQQHAPVSTSPEPGQGAPPPAPAGGAPSGGVDASKMSPQEFQRHLASLGVGPAGT